MARFNTTQSTISVTGATTLTYVINGATLLLTGTPGYTVTLANPASFSGTIQHVYNNTGGNVTVSAPVGRTIVGSGFTSAQSQIIPNGATFSIVSNGTAYVISNNEGGPASVTTFTASSTVTLSPANANVVASPTGSGTVTINPATAGTINNVAIGGTTRGAGNFTTLDANNAVGLSPANQTVTISPTGTGTVSMSPSTTGNINNTNIGSVTRAAGAFTTLASNSTVTMTGGTTSTTSTSGQLQVTGGVGISENLNVGGAIGGASIQNTPIGSSTRNSGAFTSLAANNGLSVTGGSVTTDAGVTSTFSGPVIVPDPTLNTHAATRNFVLNRVIWNTASGIGTVTANQSAVYSFSVSATTVSGVAVTYTLQSGSLPSGGSLNASNGTISGTSTAGSGTSTGSSFTIRATSGTLFEDRAFTVTVNVPAPTGQALYEGSFNTAGGVSNGNDFTWVAPSGVNTVSIAVIGAGGGGCYVWAVCGGGGGGLAWANGVPVTPGTGYAVKAGNGGCWNGSCGGCSCFAGVMTACGGGCGCCAGSYNVSGPYSVCCGSCGMVAYPSTAGGGGGGGGYANNLCNQWNSGGVGCHGGGGSAAAVHSSTHGSGGGGGTGIRGQGNNGACSSPEVGHGTSGGGGQGGSGGTCGRYGEPYSNGQGNGFACGGNYGGGGGGGGTSQGGGWGGRGAVRIMWGPGRAYPSTNTGDL